MIMQPASVFDSMAATYDAEFTGSGIGKLQRERVWSVLTPILKNRESPIRILEINCGTGEDALRLAALGHSVIATDASAGMINTAKAKQLVKGASLNLRFDICAFEELQTLYNGQQFDLVFSNFGGLNCIDAPAMKRLANNLKQLVKPGADIVLVVLSSRCLWEIGYYGLKGKLKTAFRRLKGSADFNTGAGLIPVYYYSPRKLKKILSAEFSFQKAKPVGLFIPPSYLESRFTEQPDKLERLNTMENKFGFSALSGFADHYCAVFKNAATNK